MEKNYEQLFNKLKKDVLSKSAKTPRQQVAPVKEVEEVEEPYTLWMGKTRKWNLKMKSVREGISIKELINRAVGATYPNIDEKE